MTVPQVRTGQPLTAFTWNQMASAVNNITNPSTEKQWGRNIPCTITNRTGAAIVGGSVLTVYKEGTVRLAQFTADEARLAWLNNGFQLDGYAGSINDYGSPALLGEGANNGDIVRCRVPGIVAGFLTYVETSLPELCKFDADNGVFTSAASNEVGDWKIIAASSPDPNNAKRVFCYFVPASIKDLQRQADKLDWGSGGGSSSSSSDSFTSNVRDYFDCSDAIKDPVLYYDTDPDHTGDELIHPRNAIWNITHQDVEEPGADIKDVEYVVLPELDCDGEPIHDIDFMVYGCAPGQEDVFLRPGEGELPSGVGVTLTEASSGQASGTVEVVSAVSTASKTYMTGITPTTTRPEISVSGTFVTSVGTGTNVLSGITPTTGSIGISGTNGVTCLTGMTLSGGSATLSTTADENQGIEVVVGISCENGQLRVQTARLAVAYIDPSLTPTSTTLSITGGNSVITALTPQTVSVVQAGTESTGSPTAALTSDVLTAVAPQTTTETLATGADTKRLGANLTGIRAFTPVTAAYPNVDNNAIGKIHRGEPVIETKPSNAVTTALLDCGNSSSSSSSSSGSSSSSSSESSSSSSSSSEEPTPDPEPTPEPTEGD